MTVFPQHPTLTQAVSEAEREQAAHRLRVAYEMGRLDPQDFDRRSGIVALAHTRRDLNSAFLGLVQVERPHQARVQAPAGVVAAYLSAVFCFLLGPLVIFFTASPGTATRREAAKAFNLSFLTTVGSVIVFLLAFLTSGVTAILLPALGAYWFLSLTVGMIQALQGLDWNHPLKRWLSWEVLKER